MLMTFNQPEDKRAKYLIPTEKTLDMFAYLGNEMKTISSVA
jgi:hypothetical protein